VSSHVAVGRALPTAGQLVPTLPLSKKRREGKKFARSRGAFNLPSFFHARVAYIAISNSS